MELTETAARALATVRRDGRDLRFPVDEICRSKRFRLSVRFRRSSGDEIRLGLLYSEDRAALEALAAALAAGAPPSSQGTHEAGGKPPPYDTKQGGGSSPAEVRGGVAPRPDAASMSP